MLLMQKQFFEVGELAKKLCFIKWFLNFPIFTCEETPFKSSLCQDSPGPLEQGSRVVAFKILRFAIQSGEFLSKFGIQVNSILKKQNGKKWPKALQLCHWNFQCTCFHGDISITKNSSSYQNRCRQQQILCSFTWCNFFSCIFNTF